MKERLREGGAGETGQVQQRGFSQPMPQGAFPLLAVLSIGSEVWQGVKTQLPRPDSFVAHGFPGFE